MKSSGIGGQAVLEGIMMRNGGKYAVAVRKPDKEIAIDVKGHVGMTEKHKWLNIPFVRGVFKFAESLSVGIKTLTYSASFIEDDEEESKPSSKKSDDILMTVTVCISVLLSVGLFIVLPFLISEFAKKVLSINSVTVIAVLEGVTRILIFLLYLVLISRMKDIQRTFMYHGAEHKCINCIEHGLELNVSNVLKSSKQHKRCGTSFLLIVMLISIIFFMFIQVDSKVLRLLIRLILIPVIAGVSYEFIRLAGRYDNWLVNLLSKPGLLMQKLTTKEPDEDMIEVAIASVEAVFDWKKWQKEEGI